MNVNHAWVAMRGYCRKTNWINWWWTFCRFVEYKPLYVFFYLLMQISLRGHHFWRQQSSKEPNLKVQRFQNYIQVQPASNTNCRTKVEAVTMTLFDTQCDLSSSFNLLTFKIVICQAVMENDRAHLLKPIYLRTVCCMVHLWHTCTELFYYMKAKIVLCSRSADHDFIYKCVNSL